VRNKFEMMCRSLVSLSVVATGVWLIHSGVISGGQSLFVAGLMFLGAATTIMNGNRDEDEEDED
jgi:hypothetical protein